MEGASSLRLSGLVVKLVVVTAFVAGVALAGSPARAQGFGWFGNLFGGAPVRPAQPAYPGYGYGPDVYTVQPRPRPPRRRASVKAPRDLTRETPKEVAEKPAPKDTSKATLFVYVFGDSLGQLLADGLDDALSDRRDVAVMHRAKGSTGLVTTSFYDWPKTIADLVGDNAKSEEPKATHPDKAAPGGGKAPPEPSKDRSEKIDVAVMMVGVNDRQAIVENGKTLEPGSTDWTAAYRKRVQAIDETFQRKNIPLVWVGIPITKNDDFADDMAALNDIYREEAARTGAVYVDTWEAFSDDDGNFSAYGPDINGQTVRLRSSDGIHFTKAGARKLAHFVEVHVRRALDGKTPPAQLPTAGAPPAAPEGISKPAVAAAKPDAGPINSLNEPPSAHNGDLAVVSTSGRISDGGAHPETLLVRGQSVPAPAGRADDLRWPPDKPAGVSAH